MGEKKGDTRRTQRDECRAPAPQIFSEAYYARLHAVEQSHWYVWGMRRIAQALLRAHGFPGTGLALDAGCGTGGTLRWLVGRFPRLRVVGLDVAAEALGYATSCGHPPALRLLRASATDLPFRAGTFDLLLSFDVLQHLPEGTADRAALREAARVLRPGGFLLVRTAAVRRRDPVGVPSRDGYHRFRLDELTTKAKAAGLEVRQATFVNCLLSLIDELRQIRRPPGGPHGSDPGLSIQPPRHPWLSAGQRSIMRAEALYLARIGRRLPFGHSLMLVALRR